MYVVLESQPPDEATGRDVEVTLAPGRTEEHEQLRTQGGWRVELPEVQERELIES